MKVNRNHEIIYKEDYPPELPIPKLPIRPEWTLTKWVIAPFTVTTTLLALGIHLGATGADAWYTRGVLWMVRYFFGK